MPQRTELWLLEAIAGEAVGALDECLGSGMLRAEDHGVAFRHELARMAVEESINPHRRAGLHRAALGALRAPPEGRRDLARLAHHAEAAAQYARALRFGSALPEAERADLLERRSFECYLTDQHDDAIAALEEALDCYRATGDARQEGLGLCSLASRRWCGGDTAGAEAAAIDAVAVLEGVGPSPELARAYATVSSIAMNLERAEPAFAWERARWS